MTVLRQKNLLLVAVVLFVFVYSLIDFYELIGKSWVSGWDFMTYCEATNAYLAGKNPYLPGSYQFSAHLYNYAPATLPVTAAICKALFISDVRAVSAYFPAYWFLIALTLFWSARIAQAKEYSWLFYATSLTALAGVPWVLRTGNFAVFEFLFLNLSIAFLMRATSEKRRAWDPWAFAIFFGLFCSIKTVMASFVVLFLLLDFAPWRRVQLMAVAFAIAIFPVAISLLLYPQLVPLQARIALDDQLLCNPSLFCMTWQALQHVGAVMNMAGYFQAISGNVRAALTQGAILQTTIVAVAACGIIFGIYAFCVVGFLRRTGFRLRASAWSGDFAVRVFLLMMLVGISAVPRLKEYSFASAATLIAFLLLSRRKLDALAFVTLEIAAIPLITNQPRLDARSLFGEYSQLIWLFAAVAILATDFMYKSGVGMPQFLFDKTRQACSSTTPSASSSLG